MRPADAMRRSPEVVAGLLALAGLAWWWTSQRMAGMDAGPGTDLGTLGWFTGSWTVMMAAMMLPSLAPALAAYATGARGRAPGRSLVFTVGYLLVWVAAGLSAYAVYSLGRHALGGDLAWHRGGRWLAGAILITAAVYELIPAKRACLKRCRGELSRDTAPGWGALAMGVRSGGWCLGCSWALMAALFALGVMSLTWMVLIAGLVAFEKAGPWPAAARIATAAVLALLAVGLLAAPHDVPGLVVPGPDAMHPAMTMMG